MQTTERDETPHARPRGAGTPDLRDFVGALWRRKVLFVFVVLVVVAAAATQSLSTDKRYSASAEVLIGSSLEEALKGSTNEAAADRNLNNESRVIVSAPVVAAVRKVYKGPLRPSSVTVSIASTSSDVIRLTAISTDPVEAAKLVNVYVDEYIRYRSESKFANFLAAASTIQSQINALQQKIDSLRQPLDRLAERIQATTDEGQRRQLTDQYDALALRITGELAPLTAQVGTFQRQAEQLQLNANLSKEGVATILRPASTPSAPFDPNPTRDIALATVVGLLLAFAAVFVVDYFDESVTSPADVERCTGAPTLGILPVISGLRSGPRVVIEEAGNIATEAIGSLRTSLRFSFLGRSTRVVLISSPTENEGKTTTATNLAFSLAQAGERVCLIDFDLRRGNVHEAFDLDLEPGLTSAIVGTATLAEAVRPTAQSPRLFVLPSGPRPPNPAELLGSEQTAALVNALAERFDVVLMDTPPLLAVSDALVLSTLADEVLVVARAGRTTRRQLTRAVELLDRAEASLLGIVLNDATPNPGYRNQGYSLRTRYMARS